MVPTGWKKQKLTFKAHHTLSTPFWSVDFHSSILEGRPTYFGGLLRVGPEQWDIQWNSVKGFQGTPLSGVHRDKTGDQKPRTRTCLPRAAEYISVLCIVLSCPPELLDLVTWTLPHLPFLPFLLLTGGWFSAGIHWSYYKVADGVHGQVSSPCWASLSTGCFCFYYSYEA